MGMCDTYRFKCVYNLCTGTYKDKNALWNMWNNVASLLSNFKKCFNYVFKSKFPNRNTDLILG